MKLRDPTKPVATPAIGKKYVSILFWITHPWVRYPKENALKKIGPHNLHYNFQFDGKK